MKRIYILLVSVSALLIGGGAGFYFASHRYAHAVTDTIAMYEFNRANDVLTTLRDLRTGDTNSVFDALEAELDMSTMFLDGILGDYPAVEHAKNYRILLRRIAEYRAKFPHHGDMDVSVSEVWAKMKKEGQ